MIQLLGMTNVTKEQSEYIEIMKKSSDALLKLINDILDYSKMEAKVNLERINFNFRIYIDTIAYLKLMQKLKVRYGI